MIISYNCVDSILAKDIDFLHNREKQRAWLDLRVAQGKEKPYKYFELTGLYEFHQPRDATNRCPNCGEIVFGYYNYCPECGYDLDQSAIDIDICTTEADVKKRYEARTGEKMPPELVAEIKCKHYLKVWREKD